MSTIERFLAAVFLMAAVGGTAAFAHRLVDSPEGAAPVQLAAPPRQHVTVGGGTVWAPLPGPVRTLTRPEPAAPAKPVSRVLLPSARRAQAVPVRRIVVPRVTKPHRILRPATGPEPKPDVPTEAPITTTPVAVQQAPEPPRILASTRVPAAPAPAAPAVTTTDSGNGRKLGHEKHGKRAKIRPDDDETPAPPPAPVVTAAPAPAPAPPPAAPEPAPQPSKDDGGGDGNENGNGRGHAWGHSKTGVGD